MTKAMGLYIKRSSSSDSRRRGDSRDRENNQTTPKVNIIQEQNLFLPISLTKQ